MLLEIIIGVTMEIGILIIQTAAGAVAKFGSDAGTINLTEDISVKLINLISAGAGSIPTPFLELTH